MPFIQINTTKTLTDTQKDDIKTHLGKSVSLLSGKIEKRLMIDISDSRTMYFGGEKKESIAFVDIRLYQMSSHDDKKAFAEAINEGLVEIIGIDNNDIFLDYIELNTWGTSGTLK